MNLDMIYHKLKQPEKDREFFNKFCSKMELLKTLEEGEVPIIIDNCLHKNECVHFFQPIYNFFMNQNSTTIFNFLDSQFMIYMKLLDNILNVDNVNEHTYDLLQDCDLFNQEISHGLIKLKNTFVDNKEINNKINSILLTFYDFQEMKVNYIRNMPNKTKKYIKSFEI